MERRASGDTARMGRRTVRLEEEGRWVFNRLAAHYRARPPYPPALVDRLAALAREAVSRTAARPAGALPAVAELGAGAGHLALPLASRGLRVAAVEPARAMLGMLAEARSETSAPAADGLGQVGEVAPVHATAEATGLPGAAFDLVVLADVAQWVNPERTGIEAARLLAPGGALALVEATFAETPFMTGLAALLAGANPRSRGSPPGAARQLLALGTGGAPVREERFRQEAALGERELGAVVRSFSYAGPALAPEALEALIACAWALARPLGAAPFERELTLRWSIARGSVTRAPSARR